MKFEEKILAIKLRREGLPYSSILKKVPVSKGTLSMWLREIELSSPQKERILIGLEKSRYLAGLRKKADKINRINSVTISATKEFGVLMSNPLFFIGLSLYWAEGDKNRLERVKFTNSDPILIKLIMKWFRDICHVPESKFRIALHLHNMLSNNDVVNYWGDITKVPKSQFHKPYIKVSTLKHRKNALYNGTCSVVVNSRELFRKIKVWKKLLFEYIDE